MVGGKETSFSLSFFKIRLVSFLHCFSRHVKLRLGSKKTVNRRMKENLKFFEYCRWENVEFVEAVTLKREHWLIFFVQPKDENEFDSFIADFNRFYSSKKHTTTFIFFSNRINWPSDNVTNRDFYHILLFWAWLWFQHVVMSTEIFWPSQFDYYAC